LQASHCVAANQIAARTRRDLCKSALRGAFVLFDYDNRSQPFAFQVAVSVVRRSFPAEQIDPHSDIYTGDHVQQRLAADRRLFAATGVFNRHPG